MRAGASSYVPKRNLKRDLGRVLLDLEQRQELLIKSALQQQPELPSMNEAERDEALEILRESLVMYRKLRRGELPKG